MDNRAILHFPPGPFAELHCATGGRDPGVTGPGSCCLSPPLMTGGPTSTEAWSLAQNFSLSKGQGWDLRLHAASSACHGGPSGAGWWP